MRRGTAPAAARERSCASRLTRLLRPTAVFLGVWAVLEVVLLAVVPGYPGVVSYGRVVAAPLWFLAAYLWVVLLIPVTAVAHRRAAVPTVALLGRPSSRPTWRGSAPAWRCSVWSTPPWSGCSCTSSATCGATGCSTPPAGAGRSPQPVVTGLVVVAALPVYPRSMVATVGGQLSHMYPTTAGIATLAVFQLGVIVLLRPALSSWLHRRRVWKTVVAANTVIMTVFLWHMTALLAALTLFETAGLPIYPEPTAAWWAQRPLWLLVPGGPAGRAGRPVRARHDDTTASPCETCRVGVLAISAMSRTEGLPDAPRPARVSGPGAPSHQYCR